MKALEKNFSYSINTHQYGYFYNLKEIIIMKGGKISRSINQNNRTSGKKVKSKTTSGNESTTSKANLNRAVAASVGSRADAKKNQQSRNKAASSNTSKEANGTEISVVEYVVKHEREKPKNAVVGNAYLSGVIPQVDQAGVIIELMEPNAKSAKAKIDKIAESSTSGQPDMRGIMIGLNQESKPDQLEQKQLDELSEEAKSIAKYAGDKGVIAGCFPVLWHRTGNEEGYTFPFLEMRSLVTLHPGTRSMVESMGGNPIMRSMDADVIDDPLLILKLPQLEKHVNFLNNKINEDGVHVVSGGYRWESSYKGKEFWGPASEIQITDWNYKLAGCLTLINIYEHVLRQRYAEITPAAIYWPEPNTYMAYMSRHSGAKTAMAKGKSVSGSQQRESTFYLKPIINPGEETIDVRGSKLKGSYRPRMATTKPLKKYFDALRNIIKQSSKKEIDEETIKRLLENETHQSHFSIEHLENIEKWHKVNINVDASEESTIKSNLNTIRETILATLTRQIGNFLNPEVETQDLPASSGVEAPETDASSATATAAVPTYDEQRQKDKGKQKQTLDNEGESGLAAMANVKEQFESNNEFKKLKDFADEKNKTIQNLNYDELKAYYQSILRTASIKYIAKNRSLSETSKSNAEALLVQLERIIHRQEKTGQQLDKKSLLNMKQNIGHLSKFVAGKKDLGFT